MINKKLILHIGIPILIGACIYTFFRTDALMVFRFYEMLHIDGWINAIRVHTMTWDIHPFIKYSLPDGLWVYAFTYYMASIWNDREKHRMKYVYLLSPFLFGVGGEVIQIFLPQIGTFDMNDFLISTVAYMAAFVCARLPVSLQERGIHYG